MNELIKDGRIHPARIESITRKSQSEIDKTIRKAGEEATFESNIKGLPPELVEIIGRLKFRYSYGENVLQHSVEVANFSALMAEEIGADVKVSRTGGFLHVWGNRAQLQPTSLAATPWTWATDCRKLYLSYMPFS